MRPLRDLIREEQANIVCCEVSHQLQTWNPVWDRVRMKVAETVSLAVGTLRNQLVEDIRETT